MGDLKNKISENLLIFTLVEYFKKRNMDIYLEVPFLSRNIDIVLKDKLKKETLAIEAKISNWNKVIEQAKLTLLGVDRAYIAMPASKMSPLDRYREFLTYYGIGVISVDYLDKKTKIEEILPASKSIYNSRPRQGELVKVIENGLYFPLENLKQNFKDI